MKLVCVADTHGCHNYVNVPKGDIFIHCGDAELCDQNRFNSFKRWMTELPHKHKLFIPGNHDFLMQEHQFNYTLELESTGILMLIDKAIEINGIKFYGSPWTPTFMNWAFMKDDVDLAKNWDAIPTDTNVLITHGPAYKIGDCIKGDTKHLGSRTLATAIRRLPKLLYHLYGHIHTGKPEDGRSFNCSLLNEEYKLVNKPLVLEF
jgi:Icc-related predicted phosphoesterase